MTERMTQFFRGKLSVVMVTCFGVTTASGSSILLVDVGSNYSLDDHLIGLGHTVTVTNAPGAGGFDWSDFDQVWDTRNAVWGPGDIAQIDAYLEGGGRMLIGANYEHGFAGYIGNSQALVDVLDLVGAGELQIESNTGALYSETVTPAGEFVFGAPNPLSQINFNTGTRVSIVDSDGFLASENTAVAGQGGTFGWDFGSISGAPDARLFAVFDSRSIWGGNGAGFTEDIQLFLDGPSPVPEPSELGMIGLAAVVIGLLRHRRRIDRQRKE